MSKDFFIQVHQITSQIPKGRVCTYGVIAEVLGMKKSSRMVGWALNNCNKEKIPAHRVVNRNGMLTGKVHFNTLTEMQEKLEKEGINVLNDKICNFNKLIWNPLKEKDL